MTWSKRVITSGTIQVSKRLMTLINILLRRRGNHLRLGAERALGGPERELREHVRRRPATAMAGRRLRAVEEAILRD